ncbi:M23 family metallopeptidase [Saccharicrinis fermentans]|uniref:Putative peptidase n=1 Tax=Saccharicrinis fermentans DSM 9555 = JCM 21142 TaxID=869213 RepID=W7Y6T0_9BACT|nr:M23 family metallopeptidase [Saccharicrinis fermentans]GAF03368.1 putative peptidase [Saccharicrinis fermentans DSM 9555 = JCM 21142]
MIKLLNLHIIILTLITSTIYSQQVPRETFLFPMDITPSVSGSFAELRTNHFHSGIDLSTHGKMGVPVKSMEKGTVSRIKVSPVGYGNAVYIKHPNGYTTVYGHLRNYAPKIDSVITAEQYKIKSFAIDFFPSTEIEIKKGEIIGYSGNSGSSGGPHLHYEIRDTETEEPMNPFFFQNKIKDDVRPKIMNIRLYPLDNKSSINGSPSAKNYPVVFYDGAYHLKGNPTIYASGKIGLGIEMLDYMSGSWNKCGLYKLNMKVNNLVYYSWELNRFSFDESRYINSHIDYAYKAKYGKRFERCFRQPGNQLRIYGEMHNNGIILMDTLKTVQISAFDAANNLAYLKFKLLKGKTPNTPTVVGSKLSYTTAHILKNEGIQCLIPQGALYEDAIIQLSKKRGPANKLFYEIGDPYTPLHTYMNISILIPDSLKEMGNKVCLATIQHSNKANYAGGKINNDSIHLATRSFGKYTFAIDSIPPTIRAQQNIRGRVFPLHSKLSFKIHDDFSGIASYECLLNKKWTLCEYDAKTNRLTCPLSKAPVEKGKQYNFELIITDNCGNEKTLESYFTTGN